MPNQKVIVTVMDEFIGPVDNNPKRSMRGVLSAYAKPSLIVKEKDAWGDAMVEKYSNI